MNENKKGFTLIEVLIVVVILAVIVLITIPSVRKIMQNSNEKKYIAYENVLKENLKLYSNDNKENLWSNLKSGGYSINFTSELQQSNPDIVLEKGCYVNNLVANKNDDGTYSYEACITCEKDGKVVYKTDINKCTVNKNVLKESTIVQ